jgi:hypothetical protein
MVAVLAALLFSAAFAASIWAMFVTIAPRIGYMRELLNGTTVPALAPAVAPRVRNVTRPAAVSTLAPRPMRAAA